MSKSKQDKEGKLVEKYGINEFSKIVEKQPELKSIYLRFCKARKAHYSDLTMVAICLFLTIGTFILDIVVSVQSNDIQVSVATVAGLALTVLYVSFSGLNELREELYVHQMALGVKKETISEILMKGDKNDPSDNDV